MQPRPCWGAQPKGTTGMSDRTAVKMRGRGRRTPSPGFPGLRCSCSPMQKRWQKPRLHTPPPPSVLLGREPCVPLPEVLFTSQSRQSSLGNISHHQPSQLLLCVDTGFLFVPGSQPAPPRAVTQLVSPGTSPGSDTFHFVSHSAAEKGGWGRGLLLPSSIVVGHTARERGKDGRGSHVC